MTASQLKRLKASLREQGVVGPQKSKKARKNGQTPDQRIQRSTALASIRENFNPFEVKAPVRPKKMAVTTLQSKNAAKGLISRPGVTKSMGEETRRRTLLLEMQSRNKVGGLKDRRIGENNPNMTNEERALKRFTHEKRKKGKSVFDLEGDDGEELLTHGGRALDLNGDPTQRDDFDAGSLSGLSDDEGGLRISKRKRSLADGDAEDAEFGQEDEEPERKKTRAEIMKNVIAKSKFHKYERQQAKEDDDNVREELDKGLADLQAALVSFQTKTNGDTSATAVASSAGMVMNADRAALMGASDKEYEKRMREIAMDIRSKATERTKTDDEIAKEETKRLNELEAKRLQRMQGEEDEEDVEEDAEQVQSNGFDGFFPEAVEDVDDAAGFGLKQRQGRVMERPPGFEDEDEFIIEDDLIASSETGSDDAASVASEDSDGSDLPDELLALQATAPEYDGDSDMEGSAGGDEIKVPTAIECPTTPLQVRNLFKSVDSSEIPETIRRVRVATNAAAEIGNKAKLGDFAVALVAEIGSDEEYLPLPVTEQIIRHIHSLSRTYPLEIARAFRAHLSVAANRTSLGGSDLMVLTAIGSIYPTSDHFHPVVTPAITLMARWLGLTSPKTTQDIKTGAFVVGLALDYQKLSKRYMPETVRFTVAALSSAIGKQNKGLLLPHIANLRAMATLWSGKSALVEMFVPAAVKALHTHARSIPLALQVLQHLTLTLESARQSRKPLQLHNHKPIAIKATLPKFESDFQPHKHYDPSTERAATTILQKQYKRERKGAMRELRKDANFMAREKLREKKEKDAAYEAKYKRLVASIQGEEGREKNEYEREKRIRKSKR